MLQHEKWHEIELDTAPQKSQLIPEKKLDSSFEGLI